MSIQLKFNPEDVQGFFTISAEDARNPNATFDRTINLLSQAERKACARDIADRMGMPGTATEIENKLRERAREVPGVCLPSFIDVPTLMQNHPELKPTVIPNFLREGETANIVGGPKSRKSWLAIDLAMHLAMGLPWFNRFHLEKSRVLYLDNELHPETSANRFKRIMERRELQSRDLSELCIQNFRGQQTDILRLESYFDEIRDDGFKLIILDALYRFIPPEIDENSNSQMTAVYNAIDRYASSLNCAFLLVHHSTKGNQAGKSITDVGAGAGSQSRAADTHIVIREHVEPDAVVLQLVTRSFAPTEPLGLRWNYPLWHYDSSLDVTKIKQPNSKPKKAENAAEKAEEFEWTCEAFASEFLSETPKTKNEIHSAAKDYRKKHPEKYLSGRQVDSLIKAAVKAVCAHAHTHGANREREYATVPQLKIADKPPKRKRMRAA